MPRKSVFVALIVAATVFALSVSGCNRDKRTAMRKPQDRRAAPVSVASVRPAEVLAASAYRPQNRQYRDEPVQFTSGPAMVAYTPESTPTVYVSPVYTVTEPAQLNHPRLIHPTPELVVARASVAAPKPQYAPPPPSMVRKVPIPELEPIRYQRLPVVPTNSRPAAEIMMSKGKQQLTDRQEIRRALAPLAQTPESVPQQKQKSWIASPITAMRSTR